MGLLDTIEEAANAAGLGAEWDEYVGDGADADPTAGTDAASPAEPAGSGSGSGGAGWPVPASAAGWRDAALLVAGGLVGWAAHPCLWAVAGPPRWAAVLLATAAQESGYNRDAEGDGGASVGMLQVNDAHVTDGTISDAGRRSPLVSGWWAAGYVQRAIREDKRWLVALLAPTVAAGCGFQAFRYLWTHGSDGLADSTAAERAAAYDAEGQSARAWRLWRGLSLLPALAGGWFLWRVVAQWRAAK